jgi:hypothetical protein
MGIVRALVHWLVRWLWILGVIASIMLWGATESPAAAETFQEVFCRYLCPPLDRGLKNVDTRIRLAWVKWKGRTRSVLPRPVPGRGPSCGRLPDVSATARCCIEPNARLIIEFVGNNPYAYPDTPWRAVCKQG